MGTFRISRRVAIAADPALVHGLVNDLREWPAWSPWEGLDDALVRSYSGAERGVGAHYAWVGNRKAGQGAMEIVGSTPEEVSLELRFLKPFKATNAVVFTIAAVGDGADVTWQMTGEQTGLKGLVGRVLPMDRLLGKDFERGLAQLKTVAEA